MTTGQHIKKRREELNISQTELANRVKISKQTLYKYEHDIVTNIPYDTVIALADALDCTGAHLLGWEDEPQDPTLGDKLVESYQKRELLDKIATFDNDQVSKALDFLTQYEQAKPEVQAAILTLLKSQQ